MTREEALGEFKVGDWVKVTLVHNKSHSFIVKYSSTWDQPEHYTKELWKPQPGEWCWFNHGYHINPTLIKYTNQCTDKCEPFIGTLPSLIKDKEWKLK